MCRFKAAELLQLRREIAKDQKMSVTHIAMIVKLIDESRHRHFAETGCECWSEALEESPSEFSKIGAVAILVLLFAGLTCGAQTLQKHEVLQAESCYDRISKGREAFIDAARVSNNANTVDDLLSLWQQTSQPGTIRMICTNKRAADIFELKVSLATYIARVGDARE